MKRGAQQTQPSTSTEEEGPLAGLLPELVPIMASFLPSFSLTGQLAVQSVSKKWHSSINKKYFSNQALIDCVETQADCLRLLKDDALFKRFNLNELLQIVCKHPAMVDAIIDRLNAEQLVTLGKRDIEVARRILNTPEIAAKLSRGDASGNAYELMGYHLELAQAYLSSPDFPHYITGTQLQSLGYHLPAAMHIFNTPALFAHLHDFNLIHLCKRHPVLLKQLLARRQEPLCAAALARTAGGIEVKEFVRDQADNIDMATYLFDEHHDLLSGNDLAYLGSKHLSIAQTILNTPALLAKLSTENLVKLGNAHESIAQYLLANQALRDRFTAPEIENLQGFKLTIMQLMEDNNLLEQRLSALSPANREEAIKFFNMYKIPQIQALLFGHSLEDYGLKIVEFSLENEWFRNTYKDLINNFALPNKCSGAQLAYFIAKLNNPELKQHLTPEVLNMLCQSSSQAATMIFNDETLRDKLSPHCLKALFVANEEYAKLILDTPALCTKLKEALFMPRSFLHEVCNRHLIAGQRLLQDHSFLQSDVKEEMETLQNVLAIREQIVATKDALLRQDEKITNPAKRRRLKT